VARGPAAVAALAVTAVLLLSASASGAPSDPRSPGPPNTLAAAAPGSASARPSPSVSPSRPSGSPSPSPTATPPGPGAQSYDVRPPGPRYGAYGSLRTTGSTTVALTFDDGPDPVNTPALLDLLQQYNIKATFCVVGFRARDRPDLIRRIAAEGHSLCNHSWQHLTDLSQRTVDYINWDLLNTIYAIHSAAPNAPVRYFRAPGGNFTPALIAMAQKFGMSPIYWDVDPRDWDHTDGYGDAHINRVIGAVQYQCRQGSIVLSHDNGQPNTVEAYRVLLPWLKARYTLVPLL